MGGQHTITGSRFITYNPRELAVAHFPGLGTIDRFGKRYIAKPIFSIDFGRLGTTFPAHLLRQVKRSLMGLSCLG
jgi:hypothetical protein